MAKFKGNGSTAMEQYNFMNGFDPKKDAPTQKTRKTGKIVSKLNGRALPKKPCLVTKNGMEITMDIDAYQAQEFKANGYKVIEL